VPCVRGDAKEGAESEVPEAWTRIWMGCNVTAWVRMLWRARFRVSLNRLHVALLITICSLLNSLAGLLQGIVFVSIVGRRKLRVDPIFIVGHWRTGTTFLHRLLSMHRGVNCPTTWECFAPNASLILSERLAEMLLPMGLPSSRPMDDVKMSWWEPQEHEFAMINMGHRSPYLRFAFPYSFNRPGDLSKLLTLSAREKTHWIRDLQKFMQIVAYRRLRCGWKAFGNANAGRMTLVLKGPPDTCRMDILSESFPHARFVHLHRRKEDVIRSTIKLWQKVGEHEGLQSMREPPVSADLAETDRRYVLETAERAKTSTVETNTTHVEYDVIDSTASRNSPHVILKSLQNLGKELGLDPDGWDVSATLTYLEEVRVSQQAYELSPRR
jgi:hypothetical protein